MPCPGAVGAVGAPLLSSATRRAQLDFTTRLLAPEIGGDRASRLRAPAAPGASPPPPLTPPRQPTATAVGTEQPTAAAELPSALTDPDAWRGYAARLHAAPQLPYGDRGFSIAPAERGAGVAAPAMLAYLRSARESGGAFAAVVLGGAEPPFSLAAWARSEGVSEAADGGRVVAKGRAGGRAGRAARPSSDFSLYVDLWLADGSARWGLHAPFTPNESRWHLALLDVPPLDAPPAPPVLTMRVHMLFRRRRGRAWFSTAGPRLLPPSARLRDGGFTLGQKCAWLHEVRFWEHARDSASPEEQAELLPASVRGALSPVVLARCSASRMQMASVT
jgi:hypothetical protein